MKRSGPMKRTGFKRKVRGAVTVGETASGVKYRAHGDKPMDAASRAAFENVVEAAAKQMREDPKTAAMLARQKPMKRRSARMKAIYADDTCGMCLGDGDVSVDRVRDPSGSGVFARCPACKGTGKVEGRASFVARILRERPRCEACHVIGAHLGGLPIPPMRRRATDPVWERCGFDSVDVHELAKRSHTGSKRKREILTDESNVLAVCRAAHDWIETHGKEAIALGLGLSRYPGRNP